MTDELTLRSNFQRLTARIAEAERACGRTPGSVRLLAVSKVFPAQAVRTVAGLGQRAFGENYLQEALDKMAALADLDLQWHFIGPLQSNKTRPVAEQFAWVHSVDRLKVAQRLSQQRPAPLPPLNICLQLNISGEASKSGVALEALPALATAVAILPNLKLRGLMAIPAPAQGFEQQCAAFSQVRQAFEGLQQQGLALDTLSMGMSNDLEAAVAEGSTIVRIGSALFGERINKHLNP